MWSECGNLCSARYSETAGCVLHCSYSPILEMLAKDLASSAKSVVLDVEVHPEGEEI